MKGFFGNFNFYKIVSKNIVLKINFIVIRSIKIYYYKLPTGHLFVELSQLSLAADTMRTSDFQVVWLREAT